MFHQLEALCDEKSNFSKQVLRVSILPFLMWFVISDSTLKNNSVETELVYYTIRHTPTHIPHTPAHKATHKYKATDLKLETAHFPS